MDATRRSIVAAVVGVALAACDGAKVEEAPARPAVVAPAPVVPRPNPAPEVVEHDESVALEEPAPPSKKSSTVRVALAADSPFRGPLYASLLWIDPKSDVDWRLRDRNRDIRAAFSSDRAATLTVQRPGRYQVRLDVETMESNIGKPGALGSGASVRRQNRMPTVPADPVVIVGDDGAPIEVVVAIVVSDAR